MLSMRLSFVVLRPDHLVSYHVPASVMEYSDPDGVGQTMRSWVQSISGNRLAACSQLVVRGLTLAWISLDARPSFFLSVVSTAGEYRTNQL